MGCCHASELFQLPREAPPLLKFNSLGVNKAHYIKHKKNSIRLVYRIKEILGEGGFGKVYLVQDLKNGTSKAMKEIPKKLLNAQEQQEILQEIDILKTLVSSI